MIFWLAVSAYLAAINIVSVLMFYWDKRRAITGGRRISEAKLLYLAFVGGGFGAKYAQLVFRHKTAKRPFKVMLNLIFIINLISLVALVSPGMRAQSVRLSQTIIAADWRLSEPETEPKMPTRFGPGS